jgi:hypothetical protein
MRASQLIGLVLSRMRHAQGKGDRRSLFVKYVPYGMHCECAPPRIHALTHSRTHALTYLHPDALTHSRTHALAGAFLSAFLSEFIISLTSLWVTDTDRKYDTTLPDLVRVWHHTSCSFLAHTRVQRHSHVPSQRSFLLY